MLDNPPNRKLRPEPVAPLRAKSTSNVEVVSNENMTERDFCSSVMFLGSRGLSFPYPTTVEQYSCETPLEVLSHNV